MTSSEFRPPIYLRNKYIQSILASYGVGRRPDHPMHERAEEMVLTVEEGIRLLGYYSPQDGTGAKGLVIMLHGWEGSSDSAYVRSTGRFLYERGFDLFRLNFRDHGPSHHLNQGFFWASLIDEVFQAVKQAAALNAGGPVFLVGYSMGGNFALRTARLCMADPIENLNHIVCVSPLLDPARATAAIDRSGLIKRHFLNKWRRSLEKKQSLFPDKYDFRDILRLNSIMDITEALIARYGHYENAWDYFRRYTVADGDLMDIRIPTTIITSRDDPVIPVEDFYKLRLNDDTRLIIHSYGGHSGFVENLAGRRWYENEIFNIFSAAHGL
jgi:predicted alpha/beta-fold hydrolase